MGRVADRPLHHHHLRVVVVILTIEVVLWHFAACRNRSSEIV